MSARDRLIVALDFSSGSTAIDLVRLLGDEVGTYKVGLELLTAAGPGVVTELRDLGKSVFVGLSISREAVRTGGDGPQQGGPRQEGHI